MRPDVGPEIIRMGGLELRFLQDRHMTGGALDMFEVRCRPGGAMPQPHYHRDWEETVYGLAGDTRFTVDGREHAIGPGDHLFVPRGIVHGFDNRTDAMSSFLSVLTPGVLGPEYFRELAAILAAPTPDRAAIRAVMDRYGLVPA